MLICPFIISELQFDLEEDAELDALFSDEPDWDPITYKNKMTSSRNKPEMHSKKQHKSSTPTKSQSSVTPKQKKCGRLSSIIAKLTTDKTTNATKTDDSASSEKGTSGKECNKTEDQIKRNEDM